MRTVFKYAVGAKDSKLPFKRKFLHFAPQNDQLFAWFEVETDSKLESVQLEVYGTGHEVGTNCFWLGTCQHGPFVWHLYEYN